MGSDAAAFTTAVRGAEEAFIELDERLKAMDAQAVDMEVLSINPFWYRKERDLAAEIVKIAEREAGRALRLQAGPLRRFRLAGPAVPRPGGAAARDRGQEAGAAGRRDRRQRRRRGVRRPEVPSGMGEGGGARRGAVHPPAEPSPELAKRLSRAMAGWPTRSAIPLETTIALSHLIFEGTLDRFPGLKIIAAHGGGFLPSYADRSDHACFVDPEGLRSRRSR